MKWNASLLRQNVSRLKVFMGTLTPELGRSERRVAATRYVEGLLMPGHRKSIGPMAERLAVDAQSLQQFIADSPWDDEALWRAIRREVIPAMEPLEAWIIDDTGWLKQGQCSVGVSHQYCGSVGKQANCQVSVELVVSDGEAVAPVGGRLYLPESWTSDRKRCAAAGVPQAVEFQTKLQIAVHLIDQARGDAVSQAPLLADSAYGDSSEFRQALRDRKMEFFLQASPSSHKAWTQPVKTEKKFKRRYPHPDAPKTQSLEEIAQNIPLRLWKKACWKAADGRKRTTRLAWCEIYLAHGLRKAHGDIEKLWLVVDWPEGDDHPYHCFLAELQHPPSLARCLKLSRGRWHIEQYFQRSKDDLGLDHYEGRSWRGFHHHLVLSAIAYLFVMTVHLRFKKNFRADMGSSSQSDPSTVGEVDRFMLLLRDQV